MDMFSVNFNGSIIRSATVIALIFIAVSSTLGQGNNADCFEVKHLDFFGLDKVAHVWPDDEIDELLNLEDKQPEHRTSFLIPMIVKQLAEYHPCIKKRTDFERYNKLIALYLKIRRGEPSALRSMSFFDSQLDMIRNDFYKQVNDDELLLEMIYSMDDGPLTGEDAKVFPKNGKASVAVTRFGNIKLSQGNERIYVGAFDKNNQPMWIRILKGTMPERYLKNLHQGKIELNEFEIASIITIFADGESLKIYVRPNGRFMFYTHSW
jgi:hypothetical protein